jgi:hypothetical protein
VQHYFLIHETPKQAEVVETSKWPTIRSRYSGHEATFVILHPFLRIKPNATINFEYDHWPSKEEIIKFTEKQSWNQIIAKANLENISELDRLLAYYHCERRTADKNGWIKLITALDGNEYVAAGVDALPEILINNLFSAISGLGYAAIEEYTEVGNFWKVHSIDEILKNAELDFHTRARLVTSDGKVMIATDFDQRFSYLSSTKQFVDQIIRSAGLEGFYCDAYTKSNWSYIEQQENTINWQSPERKMCSI